MTAFPPPGACDCHVHVIGPKQRFPLARDHSYTPKDALAHELKAMLARLGMARVVLVQPSFYRTDNSCMLDAMAQIDGARGVAVLAPQTSDDELDALDEQGIRGLRVNIASSGNPPIEAIKAEITASANLCERHGWHVQLFVNAATLVALAPFVAGLPVHIVFDHFGLIAPGTQNGALAALRKLLEGGKTWVKISGAYRTAADSNDSRIGPLARALCEANSERIVWGSDWPHTPKHDLRGGDPDQELPFQNIDPRNLLNLLPQWLEDDALVKRVLVDNPRRLYDF